MMFLDHLLYNDGGLMITSSDNKQVKNIVLLNSSSKARKQQDAFVVEGIRMVAEADENRILGIYVSESFRNNPENQSFLVGKNYEEVEDKVFNRMSDTMTPQIGRAHV